MCEMDLTSCPVICCIYNALDLLNDWLDHATINIKPSFLVNLEIFNFEGIAFFYFGNFIIA